MIGIFSLVHGGMEFTWFYAWAHFLTVSIIHRPFPLFMAMGTFVLAAMLGLVSRDRDWRIILVLGLHVSGFMLAALRTVYVFYVQSFSFFDGGWITSFLSNARGPLEWFGLVLILILALLLWIGGVALARRPKTHLAMCIRFDMGVTAFLLLLSVEFFLVVKAGIKIDDPVSHFLLYPFFIFGLLAIGLARNQQHEQKAFLTGYHGIGVILSFSTLVLFLGAGLVLLFLPYLTAAAEVGQVILKGAAEPVGHLLARVLIFLFTGRRLRRDAPSPSSGELGPDLGNSPEPRGWEVYLEKIFGYGLLALLALIALVLMGVGLWFLFRWLLSRTSGHKAGRDHPNPFLLWFSNLRAYVIFFVNFIEAKVRGRHRAVQFYTALQKWGRRSGTAPVPSETPIEYGLRLKRRYPALKREINSIIEAFNREVYGELFLDEERLTPARRAWRRLRSPRRWPSRLRGWFIGPPQNTP